ncbi:hypothetical protein GCM10022226_66270 [Sphaerisporangium flaviroseum]|uniref:PPE family domain-containing protein n=1 Tax=Sphaerisporangium flaviroseum TaxID=509199 RepID=A0ABP7J6T0_9ACTN
MGATPGDFITSAPSVWGASNAALAASVFPPYSSIALVLGAMVSDPAQMWHSAERFEKVAKLVRSANSEMTERVHQHAGSWDEKGKDAFFATRLRPYQGALEQAADMYDDMASTLRGNALSYSHVGTTSMVLGSMLLNHSAAYVVTRPLPGANVAAQSAASLAAMRAQVAVGRLVEGLKVANAWAADLFTTAASRLPMLVRLTKAPLTTGATLAFTGVPAAIWGGSGAFHVAITAAPALEESVRTVPWPKELGAGTAAPQGFRAPTAKQVDDLKRIHPESILALGKDLDTSAAATLGEAYELARTVEVGLPGFGAVGTHLAFAFSAMRNSAAEQLAGSRDEPGTWLPALRTVAGNWVSAEEATMDAVKRVR